MSTEKLASVQTQTLASSVLETPKIAEKILPDRVDINDLLARVREEKKKEYKVNLVFFGLFSSIIVVVGLILSF